MCANTTVILNIEDANDEVPAFDFTPYRVDICEDYTAMTTVVQPVATDADSGTNAEIAYSLQVITHSGCLCSGLVVFSILQERIRTCVTSHVFLCALAYWFTVKNGLLQ